MNISEKIYLVRGQKVMLDADLAEIYGYETRYLNRQVMRNKQKFEGEEFMFQLTKEETRQISMCQNVTSIQTKGVKGGRSKPIYAFTEQGIYMLMTVLKGELAIKQSRMLIMAFKAMKDYIIENKLLLDRRENLNIGYQVSENTEKIKKIDAKVSKLANEMVKRAEISPIFLDFNKTTETKEFLLLDGEPLKAKEAYMEIYKHAKKKIYIIDNYVNIKTLHLLQMVKQKMEVIIFTDNLRNYLRKSDLEDFSKERPDISITFIKTGGRVHDRFIILDENKAYQAGSSSKDVGTKMTSIHEITEKFMLNSLFTEIEKLKNNGLLKLK